MAFDFGRLFGFAAAIAVSVGVLVPPTSGWVFHEDDRRRSHQVTVGTLEVELPEGTASGTAALVDECGILTNFHVVFGPWYVTVLRRPSREFPGTFTLTEVALPDGTHPTARAIPVVWGEYIGPGRLWRASGRDWAYLVLDRCLGLEYGYLRPRTFDLGDTEEPLGGFAALGYSTDKQMIDPDCSVHAVRAGNGSEQTWLHDCALQARDSGGPIVRKGTWALVALSTGITADQADCPPARARRSLPLAMASIHCANVAVPVSRVIVERIKAARTALGVQRILGELGYDAGPLGAIDELPASEAIREIQRDMGWPITGEPTDALWKILRMRRLLS